MRKNTLKLNNRRIIYLYNKGYTIREIAQIEKCAPTTIHRRLIQFNVERRAPTVRVNKTPPETFSTPRREEFSAVRTRIGPKKFRPVYVDLRPSEGAHLRWTVKYA